MRLGQIVLKIRAANTLFGNRVGGAVEFALAQEYTVNNTETAFVIPIAEADQGDNQYDDIVQQMVNERFGVVVALKNDASIVDKLGIGAYDRLYNIRAQLFACLLGWLPPGAEKLLYYKGGRLLDINQAWLWYQFEFQQETRITSNVDGIEPGLPVYDDFLRAYSQWLVGDDSKGILPMTGTPPLLPESLVPPDMEQLINFKYPYDSGFGKSFDTLETEVDKQLGGE
jgi:hypothetical protein